MRRIVRTPAECVGIQGKNAIYLKTLTACGTIIAPQAVLLLERTQFCMPAELNYREGMKVVGRKHAGGGKYEIRHAIQFPVCMSIAKI